MISLIGLLFAVSSNKLQYIDMSCKDAHAIIDNVYKYRQRADDISKNDVNEIVEVIKEAVPECFNERSK